MNLPFEKVLTTLISELFLYRKQVVATFVVVLTICTGTGVYWPKIYSASTIIVVDTSNIIQPLMQGTAVATQVADHARIAQEIIFGRRIMNQIVQYKEYLDKNPEALSINVEAEAKKVAIEDAEASSKDLKVPSPHSGMKQDAVGAAKPEEQKTEASGANTTVGSIEQNPTPSKASGVEMKKEIPVKADIQPGLATTLTSTPMETTSAETAKPVLDAVSEDAQKSASIEKAGKEKFSALVRTEAIIEEIKKKLSITKVNREGTVLSIAFQDPNPVRAYLIADKVSNLFINQSLSEKAEESRQAYEFIDKQVQEYHKKLTRAENQLKDFRIANLEARPGSEEQIDTRINSLRNRIEETAQQLREAQIRNSTLTAQLSGEAEATAVFTKEGQYKQRIAELQSQLDTLRLNYHDTYPDVVRVANQIEELKKAVEEERLRRQQEKQKLQGKNKVFVDEGMLANPLYQQLRTDLAQTRTVAATLQGRLEDARAQLASELERAKKVHGGEATLAELTRDYQVNRDIYQDLLRRRENARVSMNLDRENQGLSLRIQEPATMPLQPSGPRFIHFVGVGILLGFMLPIGFLYGLQVLDPRVRFDAIIAEKLKLPVLAVVPHMYTPDELSEAQQSIGALSMVLIATGAALSTVVVLKIVQVI